MRELSQQRCYHHARREAAGRCMGCGHFYCRECVSDHERRLMCADCLRKLGDTKTGMLKPRPGLFAALRIVVSVVVLWMCFYLLGSMLFSMPNDFHTDALGQLGLSEDS